MKQFLIGLLLTLMVAGCGRAGTGTPPSVDLDGEVPVVLTTVVDLATVPDPIHGARQLLAQVRQVTQEEVRVVGYAPTTWPDGCLGLGGPADSCLAAATPGFLVVLEQDGLEYVYRTDKEGRIELAEAPEPQVSGPVVRWEGSPNAPCTQALMDFQTVALGRCGGPMIAGGYPLPERQADLATFAALYEPFEAETPAGRLTFVGTGNRMATPAEARMIAEWARLAVQEAAAGRSGASWGLVLSWQRSDNTECSNLTVDLTGWVVAADCAGDTARTLGQRRLVAEELERLYEMVDKLAPFDETRVGSAVATFHFSGAGSGRPTSDEIMSLMDTGAYLFETVSGNGMIE